MKLIECVELIFAEGSKDDIRKNMYEYLSEIVKKKGVKKNIQTYKRLIEEFKQEVILEIKMIGGNENLAKRNLDYALKEVEKSLSPGWGFNSKEEMVTTQIIPLSLPMECWEWLCEQGDPSETIRDLVCAAAKF